MRPSPILLLTLALLGAAPIGAQVTAYDVYQACRHPAAMDPARLSSTVGSSDSIRYDPGLRALCAVTLREGTAWRRQAEQLARTALTGGFPSPERIEHYAETAGDVIATLSAAARSYRETSVELGIGAVTFATNSADISPEDSAILRRAAEEIEAHLAAHPEDVVTIVGRADYQTDRARNRSLALRRALAIRTALLRSSGTRLDQHRDRIRTAGEAVPSDSVHALARRISPESDSLTRAVLEAAEQEARTPRLVLASSNGFARHSLHGADAGPTSTPGARGGSGGNIAIAIVDVVGESAAEQVQLFLVEEVTRNVCRLHRPGGVDYRRLLPSTCALFGRLELPAVQPGHRPRVVAGLLRPTLGSLRQAVRSDVNLMLPKLVGDALQEEFRPNARYRREAVFAVALAQYLTSVAAGYDALGAITGVVDRLPFVLPEHAWAHVEAEPLVASLRQAEPFLALYRDARTRISARNEAELKDQIFTLSLQALLVNAAQAGEVWGSGEAAPANLTRMLRSVPELLDAAESLENAYRQYREARVAKEDVRLAAAAELIGHSAGLFLAVLPAEAETERLRRLGTPLVDMTRSLVRREYRDALVQALVVAQEVADPAEQWSDCRLASGLRCPGQVALQATHLRIATFASELAGAEDQPAMNQALRRFISNGTGYQAKRRGLPTESFFAVNAYFGAAGGREWGREPGAVDQQQVGFYLPLGFEYGRPLGRQVGNVSLFLQVIDLGAVAAARYGTGDVEQPDPSLIDFISPGLFVIKSIGLTPFSVGAGLSAAPRAQVVREEGEQRISGAFRGSVFLAVDVPLFP